jgi:antirestriction protein ArdC/proteasome lid subunit RPN8/RPN11
VKRDVYRIVTDRIIQLLEKGTVPWHQPWKSADQWPQNLISRKKYRGINSFLLNTTKYASPFWLTFKQVQALGGSIRKGEKSFPVVFWKMFKEEGVENPKRIPFLRYYSVFNISQCEGIAEPNNPSHGTTPKFKPLDQCERMVAGMPKPPTILHNGSRACYSPNLDEISMPKVELFESTEAYYSALFHELTHATGHVSRLNRSEVTGPVHFATEPYSKEELVAEMGAAFLCGHCAIENVTIDCSASYIEHWLVRLKEDRKLLIHAAAQAQKACDHIMDLKFPEEYTSIKQQPQEFKVVALRECPTPDHMQLCDTPEKATVYWRTHVASSIQFNRECECFVVLFLNTRRRVRGHQFVSTGIVDTILVHPREVFRAAIMAGASAIVLLHNHPSGEPQPSDSDVKTTRDMIRAGNLLKIEVLDHVIIGNPNHCSLRELGYFL